MRKAAALARSAELNRQEASQREVVADYKQVQAKTAREVLAEMDFDPIREAVSLFRDCRANNDNKTARLILRDIMDFSIEKPTSTHNVNIKQVRITYQDVIDGKLIEHTNAPSDAPTT